MESNLGIAVLAGTGGMLGWGFADFFAKKTIDAVGDMPSLVWAHLAGTLALGLLVCGGAAAGTDALPRIGWPTLIGLAVFGLAQGAIYVLVYQGFGKGQVSVLNPIFSSYSGLAAALSIVVFGETLHAGRLALLAVTVAGVVLLSLQPDGSARTGSARAWLNAPGVREVALAAVLASVWTVAWGHFVGPSDWLAFAFLMYASMTAGIVVTAKLRGTPLRIARSDVWVFLALIGITEVVAYVSISIGFGRSSLTSVVAVISGAFALPTILLARAFLGERLTRRQATGAALVLASVALMVTL